MTIIISLLAIAILLGIAVSIILVIGLEQQKIYNAYFRWHYVIVYNIILRGHCFLQRKSAYGQRS